tara:strand:- start:19635 stop:20504 length:870 start_codon:yes stop_codon:yes gene_type:complete
MNRKGIILTGGKGTRLYPITLAIPKGLLPVYDKPMIYHSVCTLMLSDIKDILIITTPEDNSRFRELLGDGSSWGVNISYAIQNEPKGIAEALIIADDFLNGSPSALILGDNIFYGDGFAKKLSHASSSNQNTVFAYRVNDPERFGVCEFNANNQVISLEEKPLKPKSNFAVTGLYFYDEKAPTYARELSPSARGELEITDLNIKYMKDKKLFVETLGRGYAWLDAGTTESFLDASIFVRTVEKRQGLKIACPEEIALHKKLVSKDTIFKIANNLKGNDYGQYLLKLLDQ